MKQLRTNVAYKICTRDLSVTGVVAFCANARESIDFYRPPYTMCTASKQCASTISINLGVKSNGMLVNNFDSKMAEMIIICSSHIALYLLPMGVSKFVQCISSNKLKYKTYMFSYTSTM